MFSQPEFPEEPSFQKKTPGVYKNWIGHVMLLEGQILFSFSFSLKDQPEKTDSGFPKSFVYICLCWLNIFATADPNENKNFKTYFQF